MSIHIRAVRLEAELYPMRQIVARLMSHPTYNRRGIFNTPVDPVALSLPDYNNVVTQPMDLGTIKAQLHAVAYQSRTDVAADLRANVLYGCLLFASDMRGHGSWKHRLGLANPQDQSWIGRNRSASQSPTVRLCTFAVALIE